jgi:hypothetical protein
MDFLTINLGNVLTILTFIAGGLGFVYTIRADVKVTSLRLAAVEQELAQLRNVVVQIARQEERMNAMDQRMLFQGKRIDDYFNRVYNLVERE